MIYIPLSSPPLKNKGTYRNLKVQVTKMMSYLCKWEDPPRPVLASQWGLLPSQGTD